VQDLNKNQTRWLRMLVGKTGSGLACVGDDDQIIYGF